ncbi:hypothetical protein J7I93_24120 [Bacillus sp. ISL-47]|nr:hypothetical protein [Bacillus sp. ISL-47]MBT2691225.1 hypothetical protein [Bacillus sp. ISL-47]MBT2711209.1 hypothetical protein [Pseudomonas sp. ISL-84]
MSRSRGKRRHGAFMTTKYEQEQRETSTWSVYEDQIRAGAERIVDMERL